MLDSESATSGQFTTCGIGSRASRYEESCVRGATSLLKIEKRKSLLNRELGYLSAVDSAA